MARPLARFVDVRSGEGRALLLAALYFLLVLAANGVLRSLRAPPRAPWRPGGGRGGCSPRRGGCGCGVAGGGGACCRPRRVGGGGGGAAPGGRPGGGGCWPAPATWRAGRTCRPSRRRCCA